MSDLYNFYQSILNIRKQDQFNTIKNIVLEERQKLNNITNDVSGFCKIIASQIEEKLKNANITTYWLDLNNIISIDHVILIAEYMTDTGIKRILIDPTYQQFTKMDNHKLIKLQEWPSTRLDKNILNDLLTDGITEINEARFQNYLNSFGEYNLDISLDNYLLEQKIGKNKKR